MEVVTSYTLKCAGVVPGIIAPLNYPAEPSITIYRDGGRSVGCPYLGFADKTCRASEMFEGKNKLPCIQLFPVYGLSQVTYMDLATQEEIESLKSHGDAVKFFLKRSGISQKAFAEQVGLSPTHVNHIIKERRRPPAANAVLKEADILHLGSNERRKFIELAGYTPEAIEK